MNEETALKIVETFQEYKQAYDTAYIVLSVFTAFWLLCIGFEVFKLLKINKWRKEYMATLNEDQLKALKKYKELQ